MARGNLIQVVIADDHPVIRFGIRHYLRQATGFSIVGEAENGQEALRLVKKLTPDVLILDLHMPVMDGIPVLVALHQDLPGLKILMLGEEEDRKVLADAIALGASGFVLKTQDYTHLVKAVRHAVGQADGKQAKPKPNGERWGSDKLIHQKAGGGQARSIHLKD